ncbi:HDOD domain-containing protein [Phycisphaerales bacterium AB-hyl4]|uniref:HDOD domain-containing protein n=1 Tax=Natronomicrosphaera hydrolytica TaxID=3242702 RepID=A0ABV4U2X6_9BACT
MSHAPSNAAVGSNQTAGPASAVGNVDQVTRAAIAEISSIATLPEVTMKIIKLVEDPDSTAKDLNNIISNDPALGARILKVVNSAFYGLPGQIGSINRAIVLLGLNAVKNIAIAASLAKLFRGGRIAANFNARDLWTHCIAVASGTRLLAERAGLGLPDEAFLAGLIHDIGILVEIQARRPKFVEALELQQRTPDMTMREAERRIIGASHEDFGAALCRTWKFPASFAYVTGFHHRPNELEPANRTLTSLVHMADILAAELEMGFVGTVETREIPANLLTELKLTAAMIDEVKKAMPDAVQEAQALFSDAIA